MEQTAPTHAQQKTERESAELGEILHNTLGEGRFIHVGTPLDWMKQPLFRSKQPALSILSAVPR